MFLLGYTFSQSYKVNTEACGHGMFHSSAYVEPGCLRMLQLLLSRTSVQERQQSSVHKPVGWEAVVVLCSVHCLGVRPLALQPKELQSLLPCCGVTYPSRRLLISSEPLVC